jgi:lysophospholipase L1-like esterase
MTRRVLLAVMAAAALGCSPSGPRCPSCPGPIIEPPPVIDPPPPEPVPQLSITKIMAFGDSLTEGESLGTFGAYPMHDPSTPGLGSSYPAQLHGLLKARYTAQTIEVLNGGAGGAKATNDTERFLQYIRTYRPGIVILMHGVNDLNGGESFAAIITAIETMITDALGRGVQVLLSTLPRQRPGGRRAFALERIEPFNEELLDTARDKGVPLIDIYPHITVDMLTPDGLHITPEGNRKLAEIYFDAIKSRFELPAR